MNERLKLWHVLLLVLLLAPLSVFGANTMWSALTAITGPNTASGDRFPLIDISDTTHGAAGTAKTITREELKLALDVPVVYPLASNYTNSNTTGTEVTGIGPMTAVLAGTYYLECMIRYLPGVNTTSIKFGVNYTGTVTTMEANVYFPSAGVTAATGTMHDANNATTGQVWSYANTRTESTTAPNLGPWIGTTNAANHLLRLESILTVSDTGDIELWAASEVAAIVTIVAGSFCRVTLL